MESQHENLDQVYRLSTEYASSTWSSAAKADQDHLTKAQNAGLRIITGSIKITFSSGTKRTAGLLLTGRRRNGKLWRMSEKMKRLPSEYLSCMLEAPIKNRLKGQS